MATSKEYLAFILDQLSEADGVSYRGMMGEYVLYCRGRVVGGIYDNRLLVKDIPAARALMPDARAELPYEGGKAMLMVNDLDDRAHLARLFDTLAEKLPLPKEKKK